MQGGSVCVGKHFAHLDDVLDDNKIKLPVVLEDVFQILALGLRSDGTSDPMSCFQQVLNHMTDMTISYDFSVRLLSWLEARHQVIEVYLGSRGRRGQGFWMDVDGAHAAIKPLAPLTRT